MYAERDCQQEDQCPMNEQIKLEKAVQYEPVKHD
jgi:hypothetical protein